MQHGGDPAALTVVRVPGAFELPLAARKLAATGRYDAIVALGCVIRGDTAHFDFVAGEAARGIADAARDTGVPVVFGVLTTETVEQALERALPDRMDKGGEAMESALEMAQLLPDRSALEQHRRRVRANPARAVPQARIAGPLSAGSSTPVHGRT